MNKKILLIGILIFIAGIVVSGLLSGYGRIEQNVDVIGGFTLYLKDSTTLSINEKPSLGGAPYTISRESSKIWKTPELGGVDFKYVPKVEMYVRADVNVTEQELTLIFGYNNDTTDNDLCSGNVIINSSNLTNYGPILCEGDFDTPLNVDFLYWKMIGNCDNCTYRMSKGAEGFYSRIEITPIT